MSSYRTLVLIAAGVALVLTPATASAAPGDPADTALRSAIASLNGTGYNVSAKIGSAASGGEGALTATGSVDPQANAAEVELAGSFGGDSIGIKFVQTGDDELYAKIAIPAAQADLGIAPDQWIKVDESKVANPERNLPFDFESGADPINVLGLMKSVDNVAYADPNQPTEITGTVDLSAATGIGQPDPAEVDKAGAAAKSTPFTATLDDQGRLSELKIDADGYDGNLTQDITFSDYGTPDPVVEPAASEVVPAPESAYAFFNN